MGEGWLSDRRKCWNCMKSGVHNIVCTQPFGCLPNHICGKGMMKPIKDDQSRTSTSWPSTTTPAPPRVNQENRLKLMLANARENQEAQKSQSA